jgi:hypothetical protein
MRDDGVRAILDARAGGVDDDVVDNAFVNLVDLLMLDFEQGAWTT